MTKTTIGSVLVVDDNPTNLNLLIDYLTAANFEVFAAEEGQSALDLLAYIYPDIILLDVMMPGINGFETCRQIKALPEAQDIPVIFMTALTDTASKVQGFEVGAVDYITKPVQHKEVLARINTHLNLRNLQKRLQEQNAHLEREITERKRVELDLRESQEYLQAIFNAVQAGIILVDAKTRHIVDANPATAQMIGTTREEIVGRICHRFICIADQNQCPLLDKGFDIDHSERTVLTVDGDTVPVIKSAAAITLSGRDYLIESFVSIAERKRAEEALRTYAQELEISNAELDAFAHTVAHDLKNPLTAMLGISKLLETHYRRLSKDEVLTRLDIITRAGHRMNNIIDELLLLASVRKMDEIEVGALDMAAIVAEAQERSQHLIDAAHAEVVMPATWPDAIGYTPWIEEVWANYISNAVKYGGNPAADVPPRIESGFTITETAPEQIRFWVRDNGVGLTTAEQTRLFAPFERLNQTHIEGHGLGLSIVHRIVEKLGGTVGVESAVGQGSTFYFTLPRV